MDTLLLHASGAYRYGGNMNLIAIFEAIDSIFIWCALFSQMPLKI